MAETPIERKIKGAIMRTVEDQIQGGIQNPVPPPPLQAPPAPESAPAPAAPPPAFRKGGVVRAASQRSSNLAGSMGGSPGASMPRRPVA
jgi:hypothetical protein